MSKTLLFHDTFLMKGGAERMNIEIAKALDADIATAIWHPDCYDARAMGFQGKIIEVHPEFKRGMMGFLRMKMAFMKSKRLLSDYDIVIFSNEAVSAIRAIKPSTKTYYYAHSISRHLFDLYEQYLDKVPSFAKWSYKFMAKILRRRYIDDVNRSDSVLVNSETNKIRMRIWIGRNDAIILHPPVDTEKFRPISLEEKIQIHKKYRLPSEYYISFARLTHVKRIDFIIRAFQELHDKNIVIIFGENDSQKEEFMEIAGIPPGTYKKGEILSSSIYKNIYFLSLENNDDLPKIIAGAISSIGISKNEDFGMVAIESMACGVPVIAVNEGGYRESIIDRETGILIPADNIVPNLIHAVNLMNEHEARSMALFCRQQAEKFSLKFFQQKLKEYLDDTTADKIQKI